MKFKNKVIGKLTYNKSDLFLALVACLAMVAALWMAIGLAVSDIGPEFGAVIVDAVSGIWLGIGRSPAIRVWIGLINAVAIYGTLIYSIKSIKALKKNKEHQRYTAVAALICSALMFVVTFSFFMEFAFGPCKEDIHGFWAVSTIIFVLAFLATAVLSIIIINKKELDLSVKGQDERPVDALGERVEQLNEYVDFADVKVNSRIVLSIKESGKTVQAIKSTEKVRKIVTTTLTYLFIVVLALFVLFPFYWMIITSLKQLAEINQPDQTFFPNIVMWSNFVEVFNRFKFTDYMVNTIVVAACSTAGTLITTIFAAFAFARLQFKGREAVFMVFLMTMMIPGEMMVISNYITVATFGWVDSSAQTRWDAYASMIVPFWVSVFYIYLLRQNFKQIPNELYLAAKVDGKSDWSFLWKVMVPLAAPTLISITILKFMGTWNSYVWPNLVVKNQDYHLISVGLRGSAFTNPDMNDQVETGLQMAATFVVTMPLFLLFVFFRKYIMRGVGRAGIKG